MSDRTNFKAQTRFLVGDMIIDFFRLVDIAKNCSLNVIIILAFLLHAFMQLRKIENIFAVKVKEERRPSKCWNSHKKN